LHHILSHTFFKSYSIQAFMPQGQKKLDLCLRLIYGETQSCRHIGSTWITETFSSFNRVLAFYVLSQESIWAWNMITNPETCTWNVTAWKNENHLDWKKDFRVSQGWYKHVDLAIDDLWFTYVACSSYERH
jgi:hypothetical protein